MAVVLLEDSQLPHPVAGARKARRKSAVPDVADRSGIQCLSVERPLAGLVRPDKGGTGDSSTIGFDHDFGSFDDSAVKGRIPLGG